MRSTRRVGAPITWFKKLLLRGLQQHFNELTSQQTRLQPPRARPRRRARGPRAAPVEERAAAEPARDRPPGPQRRRPARRGHRPGAALPGAVPILGLGGRGRRRPHRPADRQARAGRCGRWTPAVDDTLLLIHYSAYAPRLRRVLELRRTARCCSPTTSRPARWFWDYEPTIAIHCALGRRQLPEYAAACDVVAGVSAFNAARARLRHRHPDPLRPTRLAAADDGTDGSGRRAALRRAAWRRTSARTSSSAWSRSCVATGCPTRRCASSASR